MNKYQVKAFTIMEITVTMLLAAIVIGVTYTAYDIIYRSYISYQHKNEDMAVLIRLDELLKKDFAHADSIAKAPDGLWFQTATDSISYEFQPEFVVRNSTVIDTFKVKAQDVNTLFENQPVDQGRLDELDITILFQDEKIPYHYHKLYSSANLIERNPNAVN